MSILSQGFQSAKILISFQLLLKVLNFGISVIIARIVDPEVYGAGSIQITLLSAAILHLSRETFRRVALKSTGSLYGLMWASVLVTWGIALVTMLIHPEAPTIIIASAAMIEVLGEPFQILQMSQLEMKPRIIADSASTIINGVIIILTHQYGVLAFCFGQLGAAITNTSIFIYCSKAFPNSFAISKQDQGVTFVYIGIAFIKFFLTEGEKIFLTALDFSGAERGVFALVSNLCGIICRMFFLPVEEISHLVFVKNLSKEESQQGVKSIIGIMWVVGLIIAVYGQIYSDMAVLILYGKNWEGTSASRALAVYSLYVLVMGINGVTEAISSGISNLQQLSYRKVSMACCFW
jgi:Rft protein